MLPFRRTPSDAPTDATAEPKARPAVDAPTGYGWAMRGLSQNLTSDSKKMMLWFVKNPVQWPYRSNAECEAAISTIQRAYVALAGRDFHERTSMLPYPIAAWANNLDLNTPNPVNPAEWAEHLRTKQQELRGRRLGDPISFLGVDLGSRNLLNSALDRFNRGGIADREIMRFAAERDILTDALAGFARPAKQSEMEWLLHRSRGLGLPVPYAQPGAGVGPLDEFDLAGIYESADMDPGANPFSRTVKVVGTPGGFGDVVTRYVAVLSIGRMGDQIIPEQHEPWLARALQMPGVEISVRGHVLGGPDAAREIEKKIDLILDQSPQYSKHGIPAPLNLGRVYKQARETQDIMAEGHAEEAARIHAWVRIAVSSPSEKETIARARDLVKHMGDPQRVAVEWPRAQAGLYGEFTPHEPLATTAHRRRMPVRTFAAAVPQVSATIGDKQGDHIGHTVGVVRTPFMWDLFRGMEVLDQSGLTPVVAGLGGGKSYFLGGVAALTCRRGISTTILDPSGPLARIAQWGPIKDVSAVLNMCETQVSAFGVIPEPRLASFEQDAEIAKIPDQSAREEAAHKAFDEAVRIAAIERRALAVDCLRGLLPPALAKRPGTEALLSAAVRSTGCRYTASMKTAIAYLKARADEGEKDGRMLWESINEAGEHPRVENWLHAAYDEDTSLVGKTLLVVTMPGIGLPNLKMNPEDWQLSERYALPLLGIAAHYTSSRIYRRRMDVRKLVEMDEFHYFAGWPSGRALSARLERDSRKWNARVFTASQDAETTLSAQAASSALISDVIAGATSSPREQQAACTLLRIDPKAFGSSMSTLRPAASVSNDPKDKWRDFLMRVNGDVGRVRVDFSGTPDLQELLITSPKQDATDRTNLGVGYEEWDLTR